MAAVRTATPTAVTEVAMVEVVTAVEEAAAVVVTACPTLAPASRSRIGVS